MLIGVGEVAESRARTNTGLVHSFEGFEEDGEGKVDVAGCSGRDERKKLLESFSVMVELGWWRLSPSAPAASSERTYERLTGCVGVTTSGRNAVKDEEATVDLKSHCGPVW